MPSQIVAVNLGDRSYEVEIGAGVLEGLGRRVVGAVGQTARAFLIVDAGLPLAMVDVAHASLARTGCRVDIATVRPEENVKTVTTWSRLTEQVATAGLERGEPIVALGGGIVGDIAGFVAATYQRGTPFVQCPTTLLAMVDASVGGKTGVNVVVKRERGHRPARGGAPEIPTAAGGEAVDEVAEQLLLKNMLGAFHQPKFVLADVSALRTLPDREFRCGLAECVKHGLIAADFDDASLLTWMEEHTEAILKRDTSALVELIARNVALKAAVVAADERETAGEGGRALLNLGHTFGHALEALEGLSPDEDPAHAPLRHGEAVALGLVCAVRLGELLGRPVAGLMERVTGLLERLGLPVQAHGKVDLELIAARMEHDKKARGGALRFVVPDEAGRCSVVTVMDRALVLGALAAVC